MMVERTFTVEGMSDDESEMMVEKVLLAIDGVKSAEADGLLERVVVRYDSDKVTIRQMAEMVDLCGFELEA